MSAPIEHEALVVAVEPGFAWVRPGPAQLCPACANSGRCGAVALNRLFAGQEEHFRVADPLGVQAGERVMVGVAAQAVLQAALWAYLLPLLALLGGALLGSRLWPIQPDLGGLCGAGVGLTLALFGLRWRSRELALRQSFEPVVVRRLDTSESGGISAPLFSCKAKQKDFQR
ncbi:SoxR reducing system RseC family protein [Chitinimonas lacunae]|uniref:SoxR reducing system RseC family protein n=1 Tax=Chitinimonas lacunae TaxID=1963018 RepID=A0ABV8MM03_9NEIS